MTIELIGIIALLIGMLLPALNRARETAKRIACAAQLRQLGIAASTYAADNRGALPPMNGDLGQATYDSTGGSVNDKAPAQAGQNRAISNWRSLGNEWIQFASCHFDGDCIVRCVERPAVGATSRGVGERAVGISDGSAVNKGGSSGAVRVCAQEELIAAVR